MSTAEVLTVASAPSTMTILGTEVAELDLASAIALFDRMLAGSEFRRVHFLNAHSANETKRNPAFAELLRNFLVLSDGIGVDWAARMRYGRMFPANLNGTDFIPKLLTTIERPLRIGLIGGQQASLEGAVIALSHRCPQHEFVALCDGYCERADEQRALRQLERDPVDIVLVGLGVPKQEFWMVKHLHPVHCTLAFGVGALFDFLAGNVIRAPKPIRDIRMEWLWRLSMEPRRLFRRYVIGNPVFLYRAWKDARSGG